MISNGTLYGTLVIVIILVLVFDSIIIIACKFVCKKSENQQEQRESVSSSFSHHHNSVCIPTEANLWTSDLELENRRIEISNTNESKPNLHVALDMPPSYSDLFGN